MQLNIPRRQTLIKKITRVILWSNWVLISNLALLWIWVFWLYVFLHTVCVHGTCDSQKELLEPLKVESKPGSLWKSIQRSQLTVITIAVAFARSLNVYSEAFGVNNPYRYCQFILRMVVILTHLSWIHIYSTRHQNQIWDAQKIDNRMKCKHRTTSS